MIVFNTREVQCIQYLKSVFLEIQNAWRWLVFPEMVTYLMHTINIVVFDDIIIKYWYTSQPYTRQPIYLHAAI